MAQFWYTNQVRDVDFIIILKVIEDSSDEDIAPSCLVPPSVEHTTIINESDTDSDIILVAPQGENSYHRLSTIKSNPSPVSWTNLPACQVNKIFLTRKSL